MAWDLNTYEKIVLDWVSFIAYTQASAKGPVIFPLEHGTGC